MMTYLALKYVQVLSAAVLLGTGAGIAYFLFTAHLSRNIEALRVVARYVILAVWLFRTVWNFCSAKMDLMQEGEA